MCFCYISVFYTFSIINVSRYSKDGSPLFNSRTLLNISVPVNLAFISCILFNACLMTFSYLNSWIFALAFIVLCTSTGV